MNQIPSCIKKTGFELLLSFVITLLLFFHSITVAFSQVLFKNSKASNSEWLFLYMIKKRNLILYCLTFLERLCSKRSPYLVYGITYVLVHIQRKRKQNFERIALFVCVNVGQKTIYAAAKSIASSDVEELLGWPCLLFLVMFTLCEFGPVWNLELPNLKVKPAVF